jgi:hypothetical protein
MNAKTTTVTLVANGVTQQFELAHAERILRMRNNGGWALPKDSKFEFVDNGIRRRTDTKEDRGK